VLVETEFHLDRNERFEKISIMIRSVNKHKKQAYIDLMKKNQGVLKVLIKLKIIPH
jgi:hypothetical protein